MSNEGFFQLGLMDVSGRPVNESKVKVGFVRVADNKTILSAEIGSFIQKQGIRNTLMLSADAHMLALDDGSNNRGATGAGGFPVFQASPLDRNSKKGKPFAFSHGLSDFDEGSSACSRSTTPGTRRCNLC